MAKTQCCIPTDTVSHTYTHTHMDARTYFNGKMFVFAVFYHRWSRMRQRQMLFCMLSILIANVKKNVLLLSILCMKFCEIIIINHSENVSLFELANRFYINATRPLYCWNENQSLPKNYWIRVIALVTRFNVNGFKNISTRKSQNIQRQQSTRIEMKNVLCMKSRYIYCTKLFSGNRLKSVADIERDRQTIMNVENCQKFQIHYSKWILQSLGRWEHAITAVFPMTIQYARKQISHAILWHFWHCDFEISHLWG